MAAWTVPFGALATWTILEASRSTRRWLRGRRKGGRTPVRASGSETGATLAGTALEKAARQPRPEHRRAVHARPQPGNVVTNPEPGGSPASLSRRRKTGSTGVVSRLAQPGHGPGTEAGEKFRPDRRGRWTADDTGGRHAGVRHDGINFTEVQTHEGDEVASPSRTLTQR